MATIGASAILTMTLPTPVGADQAPSKSHVLRGLVLIMTASRARSASRYIRKGPAPYASHASAAAISTAATLTANERPSSQRRADASTASAFTHLAITTIADIANTR